MSKEIAEASIEYLLKRSKDVKKFQITFFGGEPFLNFDLVKYVVSLCKEIRKITNKKFLFSITTNATILNDEIINFLKENRFGVMVSFDGTRKIHNKYRPFKNGKGSFDIVTQNIKKLSKYLPLQGRGTVVKEIISKNTFKKIIKNSEALGIRNLALSPVDCSKIGNTYFSLDRNDLEKIFRLFEDITEDNFCKLRKGLIPQIIFDPFVFSIRTFIEGKMNKYHRCGACFGMATVSTDGNIYPCQRFVGMDNFIIGDIHNGIHNEKLSKFFRESEIIYMQLCQNCWANRICAGLCYYYLAKVDGTFGIEDNGFCDIRKKQYEATMYFMTKYYDMICGKPSIYLKAARHIR